MLPSSNARLRRQTVLEKQELPTGLEHPMNLTQCRCNIRNGAQRKSTDYGIKATGIERQLLRRQCMHGDLTRALRQSPLRASIECRVRLDDLELPNRLWIV